LWNLSLVDPDNRSEIDFAERRHALGLVRERLKQRPVGVLTLTVGDPKLNRDLLERYRDGWVKLYVVHIALLARKALRELFLFGDYEPLPAGEHVIAFMRVYREQRVMCCVPRFALKRTKGKAPFALGKIWQDDVLTGIPDGRYLNLFDNRVLEVAGPVRLAALCESFPVALLLRLPEEAEHGAGD
jgi:(1->4)-alpha-D-glucan 1-alpha-D-glucosylmutase